MNTQNASTSALAGYRHRTAGRRHGPIIRLVSPSDLGQVLKPFVFLDLFESEPGRFGGFGMHPHSGIATLTWLFEGQATYDDSTGKSGLLPTGGVEWMRAGGGVWHTGGPAGSSTVRGVQLWVALPPELELTPALSMYLDPQQLPAIGPARLLLGDYQGQRSPIGHAAPVNYLGVRLRAGETWRYDKPAGHDLAWLAVSRGALDLPQPLAQGELAVLDAFDGPVEFRAGVDTDFVLGSAVLHPHALALGSYSVHTSAQALAQGEAGIRRIGIAMRREGRLG